MEPTVLKVHSRRWVLNGLSAHSGQTALTERLAHWERIRQKSHSGRQERTGLKGRSVRAASGVRHWLQMVPTAYEALRFGPVAESERVFERKLSVQAARE